MPGLGTLVDMTGIVAGGAVALSCGRLFPEQLKNMMMTVCGIAVFVIGITGIMQGMLTVSGGNVTVTGSIPLLISLVVGAGIGEALGIERRIESLGTLLQRQVRGGGNGFADGFVKASMVVGVGAMAVMGPITEGLYGDHSMLIAKAVFDFVIIMVLTVPYGRGCLFASVPVGILQGSLTVLACQAKAFLTEEALASLTTTGSIMILCLGINLIWGKDIRVANMLPVVVIGLALSYVPGI